MAKPLAASLRCKPHPANRTCQPNSKVCGKRFPARPCHSARQVIKVEDSCIMIIIKFALQLTH